MMGSLLVMRCLELRNNATVIVMTAGMFDDSSATTGSVYVDGANVVDVSMVAGHKDLKTTLGYIHVADERLYEVVANLPTLATL